MTAKDDTFTTLDAKHALLICTCNDRLSRSFEFTEQKDPSTPLMTDADPIQLETDRLILRPTDAEDWPFARDFLMCEDTMRYLGGFQQESDAWRTLAQWIGLWSLTDAAMFGVVEKASGEWIGRIGPWHPLHWPTREVGWGLRKAYWGKGYALEAATASIDYAFDHLGWDSVTHLIADENVMSQKLAARLGSKPGEYVHLPGSLSEVRLCVWSQTKEEWKTPS